MSRSPARILFIAGNRLGDAVLASGVLARLIAESPGARITVATGTLATSLFADVPGLERRIVLARRKWGLHWLALWARAFGARWDTVADLRGSAFAWTVRARRRLTTRPEYWRREMRVVEIARQLRLDPPPAPHLFVSAERQARADAVARSGPPILALGPAANWGAKQWPAERFAELARRLTAPGAALAGARLLVTAAASERAVAEAVLAAVPPERRIDCIGQTDLLEVAALLGRCALFVGNDSGPMHLAAAAGAPTLGLFGPSPDWRYAPWGPKAAVVRTPESFESLVSENPNFDPARNDCLMQGLTVDAVAAAADELLAR